MKQFDEGDRIRIDIPDTTDADHDRYHGVHGTIVETLEDDAGEITGEQQDGMLFRVELESGEIIDFRGRDLRPPIDGEA
ncbi:hypothetical protein RH858_04790 [Halalkaliarchaeum sp. AArc-GB]|uniref:hypothetical protein n=1 Tax=Halalkaliarchaeum sp. AArc-GB TaxID=3074078 RepID=UPI002862CD3C|nr:hypothetical protein [Halalkaliarchaeum sp. AArc-GB]MDR5672466.1 hypothetical protein [Halalkaliarchaeum sp. AArc-GB]